ncbi:MAG: contractile injection system tape measure protein [Flavobacteriaceae bacterium]
MNDLGRPSVINNAGLVLLNSYFPLLFQRLGLMEDSQFISEETQFKAVHCLQYLAIGNTTTDEAYLFLNKILCGVEVSTLLTTEVLISEADKELMDGLIVAAIIHWSVIGHTSIDNFRGSWLIRNGLLKKESDNWELNIEKKAYDLLINQFPFSFSIITFPWMKKPLHVNWPY